ncbi:MAG: hypothetical protein HN368_21450 [Spirochaetales bacterium]|jgi:hypothetical protein|nr:hypothetical protein [Spirochaetales bacterium]
MNKKNIWHTVKDLKQILTQYPDDLPVLISGYENGYENFYTPEEVRKVLHCSENIYYDGEFQITDSDEEGFTALLLDRQMRYD